MRIICDFDGTITRQDTTDLVLERLADRKWAALQDAWLAGKLSGADCMTGQIALVGGSQAELDAVLDSVQLDPGFPAFVAWCEANGFPIGIVSDGVDRFIDRILTRHGLDQLTATANRLAGEPGAWRLELPWREAGCAAGSGVCKCAVSAGEAPMVYVGDGRSDFCVSGRADILFAKGALAEHCAAQGRSYYPFDTFHDVRRRLAMLVGARPTMLGETAKA
ncbi:MtnX-like HAD-IB family phosphatase [Phenylobacterium sp.]|jgi:2,3-diketo-5-methylthio-1-phosphopentane phosphatase|uniref:MtnX-like HAD-IB family phosphatase n=1 Tax=Phenylobacterium sp. TaxID=1871053 RepID=UPI002F408855